MLKKLKTYYSMGIYFAFMLFGVALCILSLIVLIQDIRELGFPPSTRALGLIVVLFPIGILIFKGSQYLFRKEKKKLHEFRV